MSPQEMKPLNLKVSAPGKVILFGEYSVVFNKPAVAATLCLRTVLHLKETDTGNVDLEFSPLGLCKKFPLEHVKKCFKIPSWYSTDSWEEHLQSVTHAFQHLYEQTFGVFDLTDAQKYSLVTFFHCFIKIFASSTGFRVKVDSELPVGSGVGSSASFSVVISAAALIYEFHMKRRNDLASLIERDEDGIVTVSKKFRDQLSEMAFTCEKFFHGNPSGVDHNTILQGCMLEILLVNTNVPRSTKKLLDSVKQLKEDHPEVIDCVLQAMENVAKSAIADLKILKKKREDVNTLDNHFGELVTLNHNLLRVLGTSHPTLEQIVSVAKAHNLNAKLTGGGGGGFGFIYLPSDVEASVVSAVEKELLLAGFTPYQVTLGGPGLTVEEINY